MSGFLRALLVVSGMIVLASGCSIAERPFVWTDPRLSVTKQVELTTLHRFGTLIICYNEADVALARKLAIDTCGEYGLQAMYLSSDRMQCKMSAPNRMNYRCYDPQMRFASGAWVNPFNKNQVKTWQREQMALTDKPLNEIYAGPTRKVPEDLMRDDAGEPAPLVVPDN